MSDGGLRVAIEQMEAWAADPNWIPEPEALIQWNEAFLVAKMQATKAGGWADLVVRAHAVGERVEMHTERLVRLQDEIRSELEAQGRGNRALRGYGSSTT